MARDCRSEVRLSQDEDDLVSRVCRDTGLSRRVLLVMAARQIEANGMTVAVQNPADVRTSYGKTTADVRQNAVQNPAEYRPQPERVFLRRKEDLHGVGEEGEPTGEENQSLTRLGSASPNKARVRKFNPETEAWATKIIKSAEPYVGHPDGARKVLRKIGATDRADFEGALQAWIATGDDRRFCELVRFASANNWRRFIKPEKAASAFEEGSPEWFQEYQRTHRPVI